MNDYGQLKRTTKNEFREARPMYITKNVVEVYAEVYTFNDINNVILLTKRNYKVAITFGFMHCICALSAVSLTTTSYLTYCERTVSKPTGYCWYASATAYD